MMCKTTLFFAFVCCFLNGYTQQDLHYFAGTWQFDIVFAGNTTGKPDLSATWTVEKGLDSSFCLLGHVELNGGTFTREQISWNAGSKLFVRTVATNTGSFIVLTTEGWKGDSLTWTGTQSGVSGVTYLKEAIFRESPDKFTARFYSLQNDSWTLLQTEYLYRKTAVPAAKPLRERETHE